MTKRKLNPKPKEGNTNAVQLKTEKLKQQAYKEYCKHLEKGLSKEAFHFVGPGGEHASWQTLETYIKEDPLVFNPLLKERAMAKQQALIEGWLMESAEGTRPKANIAAIQMLMRNKFGWDKRQDVHLYEHKAKLDNFCDEWDKERDSHKDMST